MTVIFDSSWPSLTVKDATEAFMVGDDMIAYDEGRITAEDFIEQWGMHPDADFVVSFEAN
jgi:ABC-type proline/glycine betaine transport system ATPase subunit